MVARPGVLKPTMPLPVSGQPRIRELDALRGFALCGILFVNIQQITSMIGRGTLGAEVIELGFHQRFFPIFSFLFGLSFAIFLRNAQEQLPRPRLVLLRRLVVLGVFGLIHHVLQPDEALLPYAIFGIMVLLPASWFHRSAVLACGVLATIVGFTVVDGGLLLIPGLFLLAQAATAYDIPYRLHRYGWHLVGVFVVTAPLAVGAAIWQSKVSPFASHAPQVAAIAGLVGAIAYAAGFLLLLRTPLLRSGLSAVMEPLGRMALTNYMSATLLILAASAPLGHSDRYPALFAISIAIIVGQVAYSRWWLVRYHCGPVEWLWRTTTVLQPVPFRRTAPVSRSTPGPPPSHQ